MHSAEQHPKGDLPWDSGDGRGAGRSLRERRWRTIATQQYAAAGRAGAGRRRRRSTRSPLQAARSGPGRTGAAPAGPDRPDRAPRPVARLGCADGRGVRGRQGEGRSGRERGIGSAETVRTDRHDGSRGVAMSGSRKDTLLMALEAEVGGRIDGPGHPVHRRCRRLVAVRDCFGVDWHSLSLEAIHELAFSNVVDPVPGARRGRQQGVRRMGHRSRPHWAVSSLSEDAVLEATGRHVQLAGATVADFRDGQDPVVPDLFRRHLADRAARRRLTEGPRRGLRRRATIRIRSTSNSSRRRSVVRRPPRWASVTRSSWRSSCATAAGSSPASVAGPGATAASCRVCGSIRPGRSLARRPGFIAAAEAEAAARGCTQTVHFTWGFQARASVRAGGLRTRRSSRGLPVGDGRPLVPQASERPGR